MAGSESGQRQEPTSVRRTEGDPIRCQALADAGAGISPGEADVLAEAGKVERFRCVIYLCGAPNTNFGAPRKECIEYAEALGWEITGLIEDHTGLLPPEGRDGLRQAVDRIKRGEAGVVVTACRSMISPVPREYDQVTREIENAGGFLHVMDSARSANGVERC